MLTANSILRLIPGQTVNRFVAQATWLVLSTLVLAHGVALADDSFKEDKAKDAEVRRAGVEVEYTTFRSEKVKLHPWEGKHIVLLTASAELDNEIMSDMTAVFDRVYEYYHEVTGREPQPLSNTQINGRTTIAVVDDTYGAGCGHVGKTGIELMTPYFDVLYQGVQSRQEYDQVLFYEFGRNFWFYGDQLEYQGKDDTGSITTGYAVFMRFMAMEAVGVKGGPFRDKTFTQFRQIVEGLVDTYEQAPELTWHNTLLIREAPQSALDLNATDLFASFLFRLRRDYGGGDFLKRLWAEVLKRPKAKTTQDAVDNFIIAASLAARCDLTELFTRKWKWPMSEAAKEYVGQRVAAHIESKEKKPASFAVIPVVDEEVVGMNSVFRIHPYTRTEHGLVELPDRVHWEVYGMYLRDDEKGVRHCHHGVHLFLHDKENHHWPLIVSMDVPTAVDLRDQLEQTIELKKRRPLNQQIRNDPVTKIHGMRCVEATAPYEISEEKEVDLPSRVKWNAYTVYFGRSEKGRIVEDCVLLVLEDGERFWPFLCKMDLETATKLLDNIKRVIQGKNE